MEFPGLEKLVRTVRALRDPQRGCPWDRAQTHATLKPYAIEEVYEFLESLDSVGPEAPGTWEELGDVLFQVVLHAELLHEKNLTELDSIAERAASKLIERHPHVFDPDFPRFSTPEEVSRAWEQIKAQNRSAALPSSHAQKTSLLPKAESLRSIPRSLPALQRAARMGEKAASFGFDWVDAASVLAKVDEEAEEFRQALQEANGSVESDDTHVKEELGDWLFAVAQYARKRKWDPEALLNAANLKFQRRFECVEQLVEFDAADWNSLDAEALENYWQRAKVRLDTL